MSIVVWKTNIVAPITLVLPIKNVLANAAKHYLKIMFFNKPSSIILLYLLETSRIKPKELKECKQNS